jgi:hypothetical protein
MECETLTKKKRLRSHSSDTTVYNTCAVTKFFGSMYEKKEVTFYEFKSQKLTHSTLIILATIRLVPVNTST